MFKLKTEQKEKLARKKPGYYFNYVMSQKANFSRKKLYGQGEATKAKKSQEGKAETT